VIKIWNLEFSLVLKSCVECLFAEGHNTDVRRLTTGIPSEKCAVRRFRRCANAYLHTNLDSSDRLLHT